ncbi:hypothetical protein NDI76_12110 [Halogeometricum sp. S1BR25-6]|uniref:Cox cluster protein n=1 Tax=Halogeometricum salsisoli TaxID=2950536 RepID=A0ABU2GFA7_9EURY|nr:hypothetical protein [Halogeometricum sp. S1BR25-6]MDS0299486.1 hypothetical protein [Halogeometricum sp. S1BR25-6]
MSSEDDDSGGYVHRPGGAPGTETTREEPEAVGFGTRGWGLVAVLVLCTLVVPGIIYLDPSVFAAVGIPYTVALLILPLVPAGVLGLTAVWSMTGATRGERED